MSKFNEGSTGQSGLDRWQATPIDWGRVFRGEPFKGERESPLHYPIRAVGRYQAMPPEEVNQDTGEVTSASYWERRTSSDGSYWWPVAAHRRAETGNYTQFGPRVAAPNFQPVSDRYGKD